MTKDLESWPTFIELTERRNLFVHTGGKISSQYLQVCRANKVRLPENLQVGDLIGLNRQYLIQAYNCLAEIGVKLAHVLWRKIRPDEREAADKNIIHVCYDLLVKEEYDLALILLLFATQTLKKWSSEQNRRVLIVNLAIAYKWLGKEEHFLQTLAAEDWTACALKFRLAISVLRDEFEEAADLMKKIGARGEVTKIDYHD